MAAEPRTVRISDLLGNYEVRRLCGRALHTKALQAPYNPVAPKPGPPKPVQRHTLIRWREHHDFPAPIKKLRQGELWDAQDVRAWLAERA